MDIEIIAGLGNPGSRYESTRHNLGFRLVDAIFERERQAQGLRWVSQGALEYVSLRLEGAARFLVKPQSFMNRSGEPLAEFMRYRNIAPQQLAVAHDELDLPLGALRLKQGGGDGGHNGIRSVAQHLGTKDFFRVRLGIGRPLLAEAPQGDAGGPVVDWVLGRFRKDELPVVDALIDRGARAVDELLRGSLASAQRLFNGD